MKISKNKTLTTIALVLVLTLSTLFAALPIVTAHDPPIDIPTYPYLAITPNPVGTGETVFLIMWIHGAPPTAAGDGGDRYQFTVDVTAPNGDTETLGPWYSDPTGSIFTQYTPNQVGVYSFKMNYLGQVVSLYNPVNGIAGDANSPWLGDTLLPSSVTETLTVQQDPIPKHPAYPLPTEYWTRPIEGQNSNWANIASNWLGGAQVGYVYGGAQNLFQRDGTAPKTPHIMWTMPIEFGGIVGGTTAIPGVGFYSGGSYEGRFTYAIGMYGRLYFLLPLLGAGGSRSSGAGFASVDMRTGETLWISDEIGTPYTGVFSSSARPNLKGQLYNYESRNQHGVVGGLIWNVVRDTWIGYDAYTGQWVYNLTNVPGGTEVYTDSGEIERYVLNAEDNWLALWTSSATTDSPLVLTPGTTTDAFQYRPLGKNADMSENYLWNITIADIPAASNARIVSVFPGDIILGTSTTFPGLGGRREGIPAETITMWALNLNPDKGDIGELLWSRDYPSSGNFLTRTLGPVDPDARVFTMSDVETFMWFGFDLDTGAPLWGPSGDNDFRAFQYYGGGEGGGQKGFAAYGNLYVQGYGGEMHAYDMTTGNLIWEYNNTNSGVETVWGYYPIFMAGIADGKVYAFNNEHSPNYPLYKGERVRCIDAFTGEEIWTLLGWAGQTGGRGTSTAVIADGFLAYYNYYDNQVYLIGKGPSATTVTASPKIIADGSSVLIEGSVTDEAPGTNQDEQAKRFPNGVPAVADTSMGPWMEYLYMQKPCPADVQGVEVTLDAIGPNGLVNIGKVTSDGYGLFKKMWTPDQQGEYTVIATFEGSDSYWPSYAETALGVGPAPSPAEQVSPEAEPGAGLTTTQIAIIAGVAVLAVAGIGAYWIIRRRK